MADKTFINGKFSLNFFTMKNMTENENKNKKNLRHVVFHSHLRPFPRNDLFNENNHKEKGILVDVESFVSLFFEDLKQICAKYGWIPDFYLLEVLDSLYQELLAKSSLSSL